MKVGNDGSSLTKELIKAGLLQMIIAGADGAVGEGGDINKSEMKLWKILS